MPQVIRTVLHNLAHASKLAPGLEYISQPDRVLSQLPPLESAQVIDLMDETMVARPIKRVKSETIKVPKPKSNPKEPKVKTIHVPVPPFVASSLLDVSVSRMGTQPPFSTADTHPPTVLTSVDIDPHIQTAAVVHTGDATAHERDVKADKHDESDEDNAVGRIIACASASGAEADPTPAKPKKPRKPRPPKAVAASPEALSALKSMSMATLESASR
jgi:hypothetical protein